MFGSRLLSLCPSELEASDWLALVSGSQFYGWNNGLSAGTIEYLLAVFVCGSVYLSNILCIAEMTSALPFGGGLYGIVRVTMGPSRYHSMAGHITSLCSALLDIIVDVDLDGKHLRSQTLLEKQCHHDVTIPCVDCERYGGGMLDGDLNARRYFKYFGYPVIMFDMLPLLPMACGDASEPRKTIPRSFLWSFGIVAANALLLTIIVGCNAPGVSYFALPEVNAFSYGYAKGLHITRRAARLLGIPASIATTSAVTYVYSIQMRSMAESGLSLSVLRYSHGPDQIPYMALLVGAGLTFGFLCICHFVVDEKVLWALSGLGHTAGLFIEMIILLSNVPRLCMLYVELLSPVDYDVCAFRDISDLSDHLVFLASKLKASILLAGAEANATRRRRKRQALPTPTSSNTRIPSVLLRANHAQHGYLDRLSGAAAYVSRMFRIRSNVTFTANLPTGTAIVKKREQKRDDNSYRGYTPEDNAKSERHARQPEGEQNATTAVHATYDKDSLFSISSELIDSQVRNHPTLDYQSKRHQRGLPCYQIAPDNAMVEHVCTLPWQDVLDVVD
eukprot:scaffold403_cov183-Ochromonas_danica.AAC.7